MITEPSSQVPEIVFSHYRPTPDQRRFSISTFAVVGRVSWDAKPAGEFTARVDVLKGAFAKMIPFTSLEASVRIAGARKEFSMKTTGGRGAMADDGANEKNKTWDDVHVISAIEIPWVAEYQLQRWSVGGEQETRFRFEDNQRIREAVLFFREDANASAGDAMAILRVVKPGEAVQSIATSRSTANSSKLKSSPEPRPGDVLITFRDSKIHGFTVFVPLIGKLQFVSEKQA
ncbi:hypothetical protein BH10BDE1_BH10BDE1_22080 [soil metagenome]